MMFITVGKDYSFEAAHSLPNYAGDCSNLHGHSYKCSVQITGRVDTSTGMVMDYNVLDKLVKPELAELDHSYIVSDSEFRDDFENAVLEVCEQYMRKVYVLKFGKCTAENIASDLLWKIMAGAHYAKEKEGLNVCITGITVVIKETEKTFAKVSRSFDNESVGSV